MSSAAVGQDVTGSYYQGYHDSTMYWTTASATFVDPTSAGATPALTKRQGNIAVATAASSHAGITFTPASATAAYLIIANLTLSGSVINVVSASRLTDGSTIIGFGPSVEAPVNTAGITTAVPISGIYVPGTASPVTLKVQLANTNSAGTISLAGGSPTGYASTIEWTIVRIF